MDQQGVRTARQFSVQVLQKNSGLPSGSLFHVPSLIKISQLIISSFVSLAGQQNTARLQTNCGGEKANPSQMVSVYSSDTRFQEGSRFPHPVSVHRLPRYQPDELFPHRGATLASHVMKRQTSVFPTRFRPKPFLPPEGEGTS